MGCIVDINSEVLVVSHGPRLSVWDRRQCEVGTGLEPRVVAWDNRPSKTNRQMAGNSRLCWNVELQQDPIVIVMDKWRMTFIPRYEGDKLLEHCSFSFL